MNKFSVHNIRIATVALLLAATIGFASCDNSGNESKLEVKPEQLYGLWFSESSVTHGFWRYNNDFTGTAWDEDEDVHEGEANTVFTWELDKDQITHIFRGEEENQAIPKIYTITAITDTAMQWKDAYGNIKKFEKR